MSLIDYIKEDSVNYQIQPNGNHDQLISTYSDVTSLTSEDDVMNITFEYHGEKVTKHIKAKDITHSSKDDIYWHYSFKSKKHMNIRYEVSGQWTGTGRFGYSTICMKVDIYINNVKDQTLTPKCSIDVNRDTIRY